MSTPLSPRASMSFTDILFLPVGCLLRSPLLLLVVILVVGLLYVLIYNVSPLSWFGLGVPDFDHWTISSNFDKIQAADQGSWQISYEKTFDLRFEGLVRHASPITMSNFPMLTHDILVTTGDFANSKEVNTSVFDHHFSWWSSKKQPVGTINLLHTVPFNKDIYQALAQIRSGQKVNITGREILRISGYDSGGKEKGWWQDSGCNTLLVKYVTISP